MTASSMNYPKDYKDFIKSYSFKDTQETYTNGAKLIPVFRVEQMIEHYFMENIPLPVKKVELFHKWDIDGYYLGNTYRGNCPRCESIVFADDHTACPKCGQMLKWGNKNAESSNTILL